MSDLTAGDAASEIKAAIDDGDTFLTICGGYQMLGELLPRPRTASSCDFIGALELYTVGSKERMIGNYAFKCHRKRPAAASVVGFENHSGKTWLGIRYRAAG